MTKVVSRSTTFPEYCKKGTTACSQTRQNNEMLYSGTRGSLWADPLGPDALIGSILNKPGKHDGWFPSQSHSFLTERV